MYYAQNTTWHMAVFTKCTPTFPSLQPFGSPDLIVSGEMRSFPP